MCVVGMKYGRCHMTYVISCAASLPVTNPLKWDSKMSSRQTSESTTSEVVVHLATFYLLFYEYYGHTYYFL